MGWGWIGLGRVLDEAFQMGNLCSVQDGLAISEDAWRLTMMQGRSSEEADARPPRHLDFEGRALQNSDGTKTKTAA